LLGLGDLQKAIEEFSASINLDPNWIYPYLDRGRAYAKGGDKERAKKDFDKVLLIDPGNQSAKDALASLQMDSRVLVDARSFLDDAKQFVSQLNQAPALISQIATAAAELEIAIRALDDGTTLQAQTRLSGLLTPLNRFQEFLKGRQDDRERAARERLAEVSAQGTKKLLCIDDYVKRDIANPKNAALGRLRAQIDNAISKQDIAELDRANNNVDDFLQTNGIPCETAEVVLSPTLGDPEE